MKETLGKDKFKSIKDVLEMRKINNVKDIDVSIFPTIQKEHANAFDDIIYPSFAKEIEDFNNKIISKVDDYNKQILTKYMTILGNENDKNKMIGGKDNTNDVNMSSLIDKFDTTEEQETLEKLQELNNTLMDTQYAEPIINVSVSFSIFIMAMFLSYKIMNNSLRYKSELFNGKLFGESVCW